MAHKKSLKHHETRILARLSKHDSLEIQQVSSTGSADSLLIIYRRNSFGKLLGAWPLLADKKGLMCANITDNNVVIRAIESLIKAGKLTTTMATEEWYVQRSLGTARVRVFKLA